MRNYISRALNSLHGNTAGETDAQSNGSGTDTAVGDDAANETIEEERRKQQRHRTIFRAARLSSRVHDVQGLAIVRNISEGGMRIESQLGFENGEHVVVSLADGDRIEGEVVWQDGNAFGIRFFSWVSVEQVLARTTDNVGHFKSRPPRIVLDLPIVIRTGNMLIDARLCDLSQRGAKLQFDKYLAIDSRVQISHNDLRPISGSVKWQASNLLGIEFHRTLSVEEFSEWTLQ